MDQLLRASGNFFRTTMQATGQMYQMLAMASSMNPFMQASAEATYNFGTFLKEKGLPIEKQPWMTPNRVIQNELKVALRKFNDTGAGNPLLLVPPEAGHNSQIVDFGPEQSLVQCALQKYEGDVYVADKLPAEPEHAEYSLDDCIRSLDLCVQRIGAPVHLVGLCQGGWQSAIYAALFPERVKTLTLAGAPIDFHAGDGMISQMAQTLPLSFYQTLVAMGGGCMPGAFIVGGFKSMNAWERFVGDDMRLYRNIDDPEYLSRVRRFSSWYEYTQPLGGRMYLQVVHYLFKENRLVKGELDILGRRVDLARIHHPLYLFAGSKDDITPPAQLLAIKAHVSSPSIEAKIVDAGHIGVFMGKEVIRSVWSDLFEQLSQPAASSSGESKAQATS